MTRRVLVVGESLVDVFMDAHAGAVRRPGGSPYNVAVALGRLGVQVTLLTSLGDDADGRLLREHAASSDVSLVAHPVERTVTATVTLDEAGEPSYEIDLTWDMHSPARVDADVVHVGSLAAVLAPGCDAVVELVRRCAGRALVTYDPNCRPAHMGGADARGRIDELLRVADVIKMSAADAAWLWPGRTVTDIAERLLSDGTSLVAVTQGADGAQAWTCRHHVRVAGAEAITVVDTVGAGDAFMAGLLARLPVTRGEVRHLSPQQLEAAMRTANRVAAAALGRTTL